MVAFNPNQHATNLGDGFAELQGLRSSSQVGDAGVQLDGFRDGVTETEIREGLAGAVRERMARTQREWRVEGLGAFTAVSGRKFRSRGNTNGNSSSSNGHSSNAQADGNPNPNGPELSGRDVVLFDRGWGRGRDSGSKPDVVDKSWWETESILSLLPSPKPSVTTLSVSQRNRFPGGGGLRAGGALVPRWVGRAAECWGMGDRFASLMGSYGEEMRKKRPRTMLEQMEAARMFQAVPEGE